MILYELFTSDGQYEDYREYILYSNTDKNKVEEAKEKLKLEFKIIQDKKLKGITKKDIINKESKKDYERGDPIEEEELI